MVLSYIIRFLGFFEEKPEQSYLEYWVFAEFTKIGIIGKIGIMTSQNSTKTLQLLKQAYVSSLKTFEQIILKLLVV